MRVQTIRAGASWLRVEAWIGLTSSWSVEVILQLRIYALYDRSRKIAVLLLSAFLLQMGCLIALLLFGSLDILVVSESVGYLSRCRAMSVPPLLWLLWVVFLVFECLLCFLAILKAYQRVKTEGKIPFSSGGLQDILLRDSVLYYILIMLVYTANIVLWVRQLPDSLDVMTGYAVAFPCVMGSRLMINVRSVHWNPLMHTIPSPSDISLHVPDTNTTPELSGVLDGKSADGQAIP